MIYTLTPNPAIDMNVTADSVEKNVVSRTRDAVYTPNGKGLNVSFTLQHFGIRAPILGFFGGFSGRYIIDGARGRACEAHPVMVDGITRINTFVTCGPDEYKFPSAGCAVPRGRQLEMLELIDGLADLESLVVSGSLPPQIEPTFYDEVIHHVHARGAEVVLDTSHARLAELVEKRPLLIKPNDEEVAAIFGVDAGTDEERARAGIRKMEEFFTEIGMPTSLAGLGLGELTKGTIEEIASAATLDDTIRLGDLRPLTRTDVIAIYDMANH